MAKINAGKVSDMPPNSITKLENADVSVANVNGEFYAITDTCTHAGASMANGKIDGENIICGWHAASFECKSGKLAKFPAKIEDLKSYKVTWKTARFCRGLIKLPTLQPTWLSLSAMASTISSKPKKLPLHPKYPHPALFYTRIWHLNLCVFFLLF